MKIRASRLGARAGTIREAAAFGGAVLIAVPYRALPPAANELRAALAEEVALATARLPPRARPVRAFSAVDARAVAASAAGGGETLGVPLASDDPKALASAEQLVRDAGCEPLAAGGPAFALT
jgi:predicted dinucleotide-binding enzyme